MRWPGLPTREVFIMKIWNIFSRLGMVLLFLGVFYTVCTTMPNTEAQTQTMQNIVHSEKKSENLKQNKVSLEKKSLHEERASERYMSSEEIDGTETLEKVMNMKQYPKATVTATGYTAGAESTGKDADHPEYGTTYSGVEVKRDLYSTIAADLDVYPVGTIMYIPDYGYGVVADKGSAINGDEIDLYYPTVEDVYDKWGKKEVEVYIVEEGDGTLSEEQFKALNENEALQVFREQINED